MMAEHLDRETPQPEAKQLGTRQPGALGELFEDVAVGFVEVDLYRIPALPGTSGHTCLL
jgi:hypothetical protein